jgi:nucleotide-binding universal stress UspA family protein
VGPSDLRPILVAVDFSSDSEAALLHAARLGRELGAPLVVLHVVHDPAWSPGTYARVDQGGRPLHIEQVAADMMDEFLAGLREGHPDLPELETIEPRLVIGLTETRILEVAEQVGARQIVMGSRGLTGLERLMLGSIAKRVLKLSPIPVTVVKSPSDG